MDENTNQKLNSDKTPTYYLSIVFAILAAAMYAVSSPISKILLNDVSPIVMASLLYLGAGIGMAIVNQFLNRKGTREELPLTKKELPFVIGMIILDIAAPLLLMTGLMTSDPAVVSLLNNFEIVATSIIAYFIFKELIPKKLRIAIVLITIASIILSANDISTLKFSAGSILVLLATICWGLENNCTRMLSSKDPLQVVIIKGIGSGLGSLLIVFMTKTSFPELKYIIAALILGFFSYGISIFMYVRAQRDLGAARTSAFYAVGPFIGVLLSLIIFREIPGISFFIAMAIMALGAYFAL